MLVRLVLPMLLSIRLLADDLYSNSGSFADPLGVTHPGAGCNGDDVSALQTSLGLKTFGFDVGPSGAVADDVQVPSGELWLVDEIEFLVYQPGASVPSIDSLRYRFYRLPLFWGMPVLEQAPVDATFTTLHRPSDQALTSCERRVQSCRATLSPPQVVGTCKWGDWLIIRFETMTIPPEAPPIVVAGKLQKPGANAFVYVGNKFVPAVDAGAGAPQDFAFILRGTKIPYTLCKWDLNADGKICREDLGLLLAGFGTVYSQADLGGLLAEYNGGCGCACG